MDQPSPEDNAQRREQPVLGEIRRLENYVNVVNDSTSKCTSPDEMVIQLRGPRVKPITWSPVDCSKLSMLAPQVDKTPDRQPVKEMKPGLRRRLTLSPVKTTYEKISSDSIVYKKIKTLNI